MWSENRLFVVQNRPDLPLRRSSARPAIRSSGTRMGVLPLHEVLATLSNAYHPPRRICMSTISVVSLVSLSCLCLCRPTDGSNDIMTCLGSGSSGMFNGGRVLQGERVLGSNELPFPDLGQSRRRLSREQLRVLAIRGIVHLRHIWARTRGDLCYWDRCLPYIRCGQQSVNQGNVMGTARTRRPLPDKHLQRVRRQHL